MNKKEVAFRFCMSLIMLYICISVLAQQGNAATIKIKAEQGIWVLLDGKYVGLTSPKDDGIVLTNLSPGVHKLTIQKPKMVPQFINVTLSLGETVDIKPKPFASFPMVPQIAKKVNWPDTRYATLALTSDPEDSKVIFRGATDEMQKDENVGMCLYYSDVCEGTYPLLFKRESKEIPYAVTLSRYDHLSLKADFKNMKIINMNDEEEKEHQKAQKIRKEVGLLPGMSFQESKWNNLSDEEKYKALQEASTRKEFDKVINKTICREILAKVGYFGKIHFGLEGALAIIEKKKWKDLLPQVQKVQEATIYIYEYERSYRCVRNLQERPIDKQIEKDFGYLLSAGCNISISQEAIDKTIARLISNSDREAVTVLAAYHLYPTFQKGCDDRGHRAVGQLIKQLDLTYFKERLQKCYDALPSQASKDGCQKMAEWAGITLRTTK